ncbi:GDYXXLXY domain-containing protein [Hymenobacter sp. BT186]|uniref:GDYXXLXY domain-containing protein n=1 Tax=Hymenobacter telluris TaxID=2816474 RepID=A0A939F1T6_9BACT|nr:GDYXXLXY domain-containing protein [Hymenobacter telluris]MBO0360530.1 GDYXXLXY domain-containing protein [Hymenobacter telluris]MBW3376557.1 GDYXXLXY domain-containing protein [Hymenobacter norwichensis]
MSSAPLSPAVEPAPQAASAPLHALPEARRRVGVWWLLAAQVLFVLAVAAAGYATGALGETVTLHTTPIDPRDLNYGDHLNLNYSISQIPGSLWKDGTMPRRKQAVYVVLEPRQDRYEAVAVYSLEPTVPAGQVVLRGWVQDIWRRSMRLRYGFEKYYVPADVGRKLKPKQLLRVQVSIAPWGQARIKQVDILPSPKQAKAPL